MDNHNSGEKVVKHPYPKRDDMRSFGRSANDGAGISTDGRSNGPQPALDLRIV